MVRLRLAAPTGIRRVPVPDDRAVMISTSLPRAVLLGVLAMALVPLVGCGAGEPVQAADQAGPTAAATASAGGWGSAASARPAAVPAWRIRPWHGATFAASYGCYPRAPGRGELKMVSPHVPVPFAELLKLARRGPRSRAHRALKNHGLKVFLGRVSFPPVRYPRRLLAARGKGRRLPGMCRAHDVL